MSRKKALTSILAGILLASTITLGIFDNPDSLYSAGFAAAPESPEKDFRGQMQAFLGFAWNFLPENTPIQIDFKKRAAILYFQRYKVMPSKIKSSPPPSANLEHLCLSTIQKAKFDILESPSSLYSAAFTAAQASTRKDLHQMQNFLGFAWNFLPEDSIAENEFKQQAAQRYEAHYGTLPTSLAPFPIASANLQRMCSSILPHKQELEAIKEELKTEAAEKRKLQEKIAQTEQLKFEEEELRGQITRLTDELKRQRDITTTTLMGQKRQLEQQQAQCSEDINKLHAGYGSLVEARNQFDALSNQLAIAYKEFYEYTTCYSNPDKEHCKNLQELSDKTTIADELLNRTTQAAETLQMALKNAVNIDLPTIPVINARAMQDRIDEAKGVIKESEDRAASELS